MLSVNKTGGWNSSMESLTRRLESLPMYSTNDLFGAKPVFGNKNLENFFTLYTKEEAGLSSSCSFAYKVEKFPLHVVSKGSEERVSKRNCNNLEERKLLEEENLNEEHIHENIRIRDETSSLGRRVETNHTESCSPPRERPECDHEANISHTSFAKSCAKQDFNSKLCSFKKTLPLLSTAFNGNVFAATPEKLDEKGIPGFSKLPTFNETLPTISKSSPKKRRRSSDSFSSLSPVAKNCDIEVSTICALRPTSIRRALSLDEVLLRKSNLRCCTPQNLSWRQGKKLRQRPSVSLERMSVPALHILDVGILDNNSTKHENVFTTNQISHHIEWNEERAFQQPIQTVNMNKKHVFRPIQPADGPQ